MEGIMKNRFCISLLLIAGLLLGTTSSVAQSTGAGAAPKATPLSNAFTYQGRLDRAGQPYTGSCDFQFSLWDAVTDGLEISTVIPPDDLPVSDGLFTAELDFDSGAFNGEDRWLEVSVQCPGDVSPTSFARQALTAAPYALYAASAPWDGLAGVPAGFSDDVDNDTTYSAGDGLMLSTTAFSIDPAYTQRRVAGSCAVGSTIRTIHPDGSVVCQSDAPLNRSSAPHPNTLTTIDLDGYTGAGSRITIGSDGLGLIVYDSYVSDYLEDDLRVSHCDDPECSTATISTIDNSGTVGLLYGKDITIGSDGLGLIAYLDETQYFLKVAHCDDLLCSSATITSRVIYAGRQGTNPEIMIGSDGLPLIILTLLTPVEVNAVHCDDVYCVNLGFYTPISYGGGTYADVTLGADGLPLIIYNNSVNGSFHTAHCYNNYCNYALLSTLPTALYDAMHFQVVTGTDGLGLIVYTPESGGLLNAAHCTNSECSDANLSPLYGTTGASPSFSLTIGSDGFGLIAFTLDQTLMAAHCADLDCSHVTTTPIDEDSYISDLNDITVGADGLPLISYFDATPNWDLKVAHCSSVFCVPYFRAP
jgi:hypothetical protein